MKIQKKPSTQQDTMVAPIAYETTLPDDFRNFYNQFHTDSIFQMNSILFPLKGLAQSADTLKIAEEIYWEKEDWKIHTAFDSQNGTFERVFTNISGVITEQITANEGLFSLEKRYAKISGKWHLIYYQELLMHG